MKALVEKYMGDVPWKECRLRCGGHVMNVAVNQLLFKADTRKLKKKLADLAAAFKNDGVDGQILLGWPLTVLQPRPCLQSSNEHSVVLA